MYDNKWIYHPLLSKQSASCEGSTSKYHSKRLASLLCYSTLIYTLFGLGFSVVYDYKWGTGMIASSSTFYPHPGRVIRDLFRLSDDVWHGTEALVYSNHPRAAAASSYLAIIFGRIASGVPWFLRSTAEPMQHPHHAKCHRVPPCPITPTLTSSSVHHSSHQLTTTFLSYYNVT